MKIIHSLFALLTLISCVHSKDRVFTASTPAGPEVRSFLGISTKDSIDFIRWKLVINDRKYSLSCNYGIGKPNTNGFINGGKNLELTGEVTRINYYFKLFNNKRSLNLLELNNDLFHFLDENRNLLVGNGGWSYALNSQASGTNKKLNFEPLPSSLADSMTFIGRTPCHWLKEDKDCYKLKWYVILYTNPTTNQPTTYLLKGSISNHASMQGSWKISRKSGVEIYQLDTGKNNSQLYFIRLDNNILFFTDINGNLLVGDHDFSYALSRTL